DYDFGGWEHEVAIEELRWTSNEMKFARCIDGRNTYPPEDLGDPWGYTKFNREIVDPDHEGHETYLEWEGGHFNPTRFDLATVNPALQKVR
ncbi:MAG: hypothetical protein WBD26_05030, partial [Candidatus Acidiferrales bacterium]